MSTRKPRLNVDLLDRTMAEVEKAARRKTQKWDQRIWRMLFTTPRGTCGTAMCFAGWALTLDGAKWDDDAAVSGYGAFEGTRVVDVVLTPRGFARAEEEARRRLGLSVRDAEALFWEENTLPDLRRIVGQIKARNGQP